MQIEVKPLREARPSPVRPESVGCTFIWDTFGGLWVTVLDLGLVQCNIDEITLDIGLVW